MRKRLKIEFGNEPLFMEIIDVLKLLKRLATPTFFMISSAQVNLKEDFCVRMWQMLSTKTIHSLHVIL